MVKDNHRLIHYFVLSFFIISLLITGCHKKASQTEKQNLLNDSSVLKKAIEIQDTTVLSIDSLKNTLIKDEDCGWIKLKDGEYKCDSCYGFDHIIADLCDDFTYADLNGDGYKDAIGSTAVNSGGSGTYISLVIFMNKHGRAIYTASYSLGDRIGPDSIRVEKDTINLYYMERSKEDAMASGGSIPVHKKLKLDGHKIIELD